VYDAFHFSPEKLNDFFGISHPRIMPLKAVLFLSSLRFDSKKIEIDTGLYKPSPSNVLAESQGIGKIAETI